MSSTRKVEEDRHAAGGPGKSSKEGHIDRSKHNVEGQKQAPHPRGPGGESGDKGGESGRRDAG